jgi:hypothetical protein
VVQLAAQPAVQLAVQPVVQPVVQLAAQPVAQLVVQLAAQPVAQLAAQPVAQLAPALIKGRLSRVVARFEQRSRTGIVGEGCEWNLAALFLSYQSFRPAKSATAW